MSRELIYTALTRSKESLSIFIEKGVSEKENNTLFHKLRTRSYTETRKTSLFMLNYWDFSLEPEKGVFVKSRVEYIIYKNLIEELHKYKDFEFFYELQPEIKGKKLMIKTDFTIISNNVTYYWEHLGLLGNNYYEKTWRFKRKKYNEFGIKDTLLTTDEKKGISDPKIKEIINDIRNGNLKNEEKNNLYSEYHCSLR